MAASLLLRQGQAGALKTIFLEAPVFRGLASTASLSAESGKSEKGLPPNPKKQSPPKNVVEPKERGTLPATQTAAEWSKNLPPPRSYPSVVNKGRMIASPNSEDSMLFTDGRVPKFLSGKTLVEFPQKVLPPFRKQGSDSEARQEGRKVRDDSSSSSSSSSDSESDEEAGVSEVDSRVTSKGKGEFPKPEASRSFENRAPKIMTSAKERTVSQKPHTDVMYPEKPRQPKKKGTNTKPSEDRRDAKPKSTVPKSQVDEEVLKQNMEEKQLKKIFRSNEIDKESQKPSEVMKTLPDPAKSGLSAQLSGNPAPTLWTEEARAGGQLQATPPGIRERHLESQVPEPNGKVTVPLSNEEHLGKLVVEGRLKAKEEIVEDPVPEGLKTVPVLSKEVSRESQMAAAAELETKGMRVQEQDTSQAFPMHSTLEADLHMEDTLPVQTGKSPNKSWPLLSRLTTPPTRTSNTMTIPRTPS
ncbi:NADH dehydrogenase [ubiquinone] flavoprotein 3, mitochondrial isoform X2 [Tupaia chinensis]|uniref:NADH dehydrogenase [ubiquinone] flavoprotein 3, mitochondrial isoform X2 n=1 Tax=Tupaia chinensis TaxID=246437 RepID=UPI0003C90972|nr:NADH dehydrogenase [ubiquinone] flavoprotein 3, mitochondrial isoform X2 [Tupaia chinensis]